MAFLPCPSSGFIAFFGQREKLSISDTWSLPAACICPAARWLLHSARAGVSASGHSAGQATAQQSAGQDAGLRQAAREESTNFSQSHFEYHKRILYLYCAKKTSLWKYSIKMTYFLRSSTGMLN
ncbi:MAG: hypothetical protein R6V32_01410 [Bacteroidales bacterium]